MSGILPNFQDQLKYTSRTNIKKKQILFGETIRDLSPK